MDESETGCINDKSPAVGLRVEYEEKCFLTEPLCQLPSGVYSMWWKDDENYDHSLF